MFSRFFIERPIFAIVLALAMILVGIVTVKTLPVAQYPDITPPTVMVTASYPAAIAMRRKSTSIRDKAITISLAVSGLRNDPSGSSCAHSSFVQ